MKVLRMENKIQTQKIFFRMYFAHAVTAINTNLTGIVNDKEAEL